MIMRRTIIISLFLLLSLSGYTQNFTILGETTSENGDTTTWELYIIENDTVVFIPWLRPVMDTLVAYDINTTNENFIVINETSQDSLINDFFIGATGTDFNGEVTLPIKPSSDTTTIILEQVDSDINFDLNSYPVRANVSLLRVTDTDPGRTICSGTLIAPNMVLTSAHCIGNLDSNGVFNWNNLHQVHVAPSFTNGEPDPNYGKVKTSHAFIPKQHYNVLQTNETFNNYDMGVLILEENIGTQTGWMGMKYLEDRNSIYNSTSYNFSYPAQKEFDGDNMFFSHDIVSPNIFFTYTDNVRPHIVGQSGSSYFFMGEEDSLATIFGVTYTETFQLNIPENFCRGINKIQQQELVLAVNDTKSNLTVNIYPNPVIDYLSIESNEEIISVEVIDLLGTSSLLEENNGEFLFQDYTSGIYVIKIETNEGIVTKKFLKARD